VRLSLPTRISPWGTLLFAVASFFVQQVQNTSIAFSALYFAFVILSMVAFNLAGGFSRLAGAFFAFFSLLVCIVGVTWKMVLGEPGQSNLQAPIVTMTCYVITAGMFIVIALLMERIDLRAVSIGSGGKQQRIDYTVVGLGCVLLSVGINAAAAIMGAAPGGLLSALHQLDRFIPLGIILGTIGAIDDSHGRRTMNFVNTVGMLLLFINGLQTFSKQGMFTPMVCWLMGVVYRRFPLRRVHLIAIGLAAFASFYILAPLSEARDLNPGNLSYTEGIAFGVDKIIHFQQVRAHVKAYGDAPPSHSYYDKAQNALIGRMTMIGTDDALINYSMTAEPFGMQPVWDDFLNFVPHVLAPNKAQELTGNFYAHEIGGMLSDDDFTTGISFSPVAETFRLETWLGMFLLLPGVLLLMFVSNEFVCGDLRKAPWSLLPILLYAHTAPEGLLSSQIYMIGYGNGAFLLSIFFCTRIAPTIGGLLYGGIRQQESLVRSGSERPTIVSATSTASAGV
jgi:hypothetical protein